MTANWPSLAPEALREITLSAETLVREAEKAGRDADIVRQAVQPFGEAFHRYHGEAFASRVTRYNPPGGGEIILIEPPAGCSLCLIPSGNNIVMVDSGFQCYRDEIQKIISSVFPDWRACKRPMLLTHADVDHCGLCDLADTVYMSGTCFDAFAAERAGGSNLREREVVQRSYERMIKAFSGYRTPPAEKLVPIGYRKTDAPLEMIGSVGLGDMSFECWEGRGGHVAGECVFIERRLRLAFTGDVYCAIKSYTPQQAAFNALSPRLMGSVDADRDTARQERAAIFELLSGDNWLIVGGHGAAIEYNGWLLSRKSDF